MSNTVVKYGQFVFVTMTYESLQSVLQHKPNDLFEKYFTQKINIQYNVKCETQGNVRILEWVIPG